MSRSYTDNSVTFNNIKASVNTGGNKISAGEYSFDENGNIVSPFPVINAIDIDWNDAEIPGIDERITSTAKLLKLISNIDNATKEINTTFGQKVQEIIEQLGSNESYKHIVMTQEEYEALTEYEEDTLYLVIGAGTIPTPTPTPTPSKDIFEDLTTELIVSYVDCNGVTQEVTYTNDGKISLEPQRSYTLTGTLVGSIEIDTSSLNKVENDTELILDEVKILSNTDNAILYKIPNNAKGQKALKVTLGSNVENYIYCTLEAENTDDQSAAIYSMNNLYIQGAGYLAIKTKSGHGIRGDEVNLGGSHIWIDAPHDGIHGRDINIIGGIYSLNNCNDAIGTSNSGRVMFYDGKIITNNIAEDIIDSKNPGLYVSTDLLTSTQLSKCTNMSLLTEQTYKSLFGNIQGSVQLLPGKPDFDREINTSGTPVELTSIEETGGTFNKYVISDETDNKTKYVLATGYISNPIKFSGYGNQTGDNVTLYLVNAFIDIPGNTPAIYYADEASNIKIMGVQDTVNIIRNTYTSNAIDAIHFESDCIKSENNIEIESKNGSIVYITSSKADGVDGGDIKVTDSKGSLVITKCGQRGMKGNAIVIGPNAVISESIISSYITDENADNYTTFDGICYIKNNCKEFVPEIANGLSDEDKKNSGFADIYARNGKASKNKGQFGTTNIELVGTLIIGTIGAINSINMGYAKKFYYNEVIVTNSTIMNPIPNTGSPAIYNEVEFTNETKNVIDF